MCHDYPPSEREGVSAMVTVREQKQKNILVKDGISREQYIQMRSKRDKGKAVPQMLMPSIQVNLRAGTFGEAEDNQIRYIKIPVDQMNQVGKE